MLSAFKPSRMSLKTSSKTRLNMHLAMISYMEARQRLQDKRRARGFWPPGQAKGKEKERCPSKGKVLAAKICWQRSQRADAVSAIRWAPSVMAQMLLPPANPPAAAAANVVEMDPHDADDIIDDLEIFTEAGLSEAGACL